MLESRADEYRRKAEECRLLAAKSNREDDKAAWLKLTEDWQRLAQSVDDKGSQPRKEKH